jgi:hypothetical protein
MSSLMFGFFYSHCGNLRFLFRHRAEPNQVQRLFPRLMLADKISAAASAVCT